MWGVVHAIHEIGSYTIVEYTGPNDGAEHRFHPYVDGQDTNHSEHTLEAALLLAMARKNLEPNRANYMADAAEQLLGFGKTS